MEHIKVILLQKVSKLGHIGDIVKVKPGFARNYLLPNKIALRANEENLKYFESRRAQIEAANADLRSAAQKIADEAKVFFVSLIRQASEKGQLYGSVTARDIAASIRAQGVNVVPGNVNLNIPIKMLGVYDLSVDLHPEVSVPVKVSVAKSEDEAKQQLAAASESEKSQKTTDKAEETVGEAV